MKRILKILCIAAFLTGIILFLTGAGKVFIMAAFWVCMVSAASARVIEEDK